MHEENSVIELLETPIPVIANQLILKLLKAGRINIDPFDPEALGLTAYRLCPDRLRFHIQNSDSVPIDSQVIQVDDTVGYSLRPGEYAVVSPKERITLTEGFIVDFYPSSWCIENKLVVTAGRLDAGYQQDLVFGVFNAGRSDVHFTRRFQLLRASFAWLGAQNLPTARKKPPGDYIPQIGKLRGHDQGLKIGDDKKHR